MKQPGVCAFLVTKFWEFLSKRCSLKVSVASSDAEVREVKMFCVDHRAQRFAQYT